MKRRTLLTTAGTGLTIAGIGGLAAFSSPVGAQTDADFSITDADPITKTAGELSYVQVSLTHSLSWSGFDEPVVAVGYRDKIYVDGNDDGTDELEHVLYDNTLEGSLDPGRLADYSGDGDSDGFGGNDEYASVDGPSREGTVHAGLTWNVIADENTSAESAETPAPVADTGFSPAGEGESAVINITYEKTVVLYGEDADGNLVELSSDVAVPQTTVSDSFTATVTNEQSDTTSSGDGSSTSG